MVLQVHLLYLLYGWVVNAKVRCKWWMIVKYASPLPAWDRQSTYVLSIWVPRMEKCHFKLLLIYNVCLKCRKMYHVSKINVLFKNCSV